MKISVSVRATDRFGPRVVEITTPKGTFESPNRALTSTESNYRKEIVNKVPVDEPFSNPVFEVIGHFSLEDVRKLRSRNGPLHERKREYQAHAHGYGTMVTKFYPKLDFDESHLTIDDVKALVDLQIMSGFDVIAIPDFTGSNVSKYEHETSSFGQYILNNNRAPMPYVRVDCDPTIFGAKIRSVINNSGTFQSLGIVFRPPYSRYYPNYDYLRRISDEPVWIHQSNVNRVFSSTIPLATAHLSQMFCIDTVSVESRRVMAPFKEKPIERVRRFDPRTLGQIPLLKDPSLSAQSCCPFCTGRSTEDLVRTFTGQVGVDTKTLEHGLRVHETFTSYDEFTAARLAIRSNEFRDYALRRKYLAETLGNRDLFSPILA